MIILEKKMTRNAHKDITRCICDFNPGIGDFICCDKCSVWQHMECMGVHPGKIPKVYECDQCNPRPLNKQAAVQLQLTLKAEESSGDSDDEARTTKRVNSTAKRKPPAKRSRRPSSSSQKSVEEEIYDDGGNSYRDVKENMYSPAIKHRLEPRTEAQPSFELSPGSMNRNHPQAGSPGSNLSQPIPLLQVVNHGPARVVITRQSIKAGQYITDYMGHFKRLSELYDEIGGKSTLFRRPLNYVLHYDMLDMCVDTREYGTISRFLRKSCHPNAKVRSYLKDGKLHLGIYSLDNIPPNSEITLPFNITIEQYQFVQTCACSNVSCLVTKNNERLNNKTQSTPHSRTESTESSLSDEEHKKHKLTREELKIQSYIQTIEKREREEQRKRTLSETLKSPSREQQELDTTSDTPTRAGKRRRKGSGRKCRKPSGGSLQQDLNILKSPEHFIFDPGVPQSPKSEPVSPVKVYACSSPVKNVKEPQMSRHHVCFNGYSQDIHLRPLNVSPFSRARRDLQLHNLLTPVKIHKDGFIVPIHGSLLSPRYSKIPAKPSYKNHKKRWLEHYIQEKQNAQDPKHPSDHPKVSHCMEESPAHPMNCDDPLNDVFLPQEDSAATALSDATKTLQIDDPTTLEHEVPSIVPLESHNLHIEMPVNDVQSCSTASLTTPLTPVGAEKKKKVSLADYRKRLQSRTQKSESKSSEMYNLPKPMDVIEHRTSSDKENSSPAVSSTEQPIFEPISPEVSVVGKGDSKSSLLEEFTKPSLSESISLESIHPRKFRKVELSDEPASQKSEDMQVSDSSQEQIQKLYYQIKEVTAPVRHDLGNAFVNGSSSIPSSDKLFSRESSPRAIDDATICKIKEILYNSNPSLKVNSMSRSGSPSPKIKPIRCIEQNPEERGFSSNRGLSDPNLPDNLLRSCMDESRLRFGFGETQKEVKSLHSSEGVQHEYSNTYNRWDPR